ncbi:hypothetical protein [Streptomyces sp. NPDC050548]|uniref:hypothetical protein n=1 Tax=Streptomyces sp. NPDC050548 TaxID=3365629 RepID=UPI0037994314
MLTADRLGARRPVCHPVLGLPAVAVPTGVVDGLPTRVQLLGGKLQERVLLQAAKAIESAVGRFTPIDPMR